MRRNFFLKLTVLTLTKLGLPEAGSIVKISLRYDTIQEILIVYNILKTLKVPIPIRLTIFLTISTARDAFNRAETVIPSGFLVHSIAPGTPFLA